MKSLLNADRTWLREPSQRHNEEGASRASCLTSIRGTSKCFRTFRKPHDGFAPAENSVFDQSFVETSTERKRDPREVFKRRFYLLDRSGNIKTQTTLSPNAITAFEKSHIRATAPGLRAGITTVSPRAHFRISSEALVSLSRKPADTGRQ